MPGTARQTCRRVNALTLPAETGSTARARAFVADAAAGHVDDVCAVVLMTSELVTNVVRHADTAFTVTVITGPSLRVEVGDGAAASDTFQLMISTPPAAPAPRAGEDSGSSMSWRLASAPTPIPTAARWSGSRPTDDGSSRVPPLSAR